MVETPWAAALGWTLIHSLWQGALAALLLAAVLACTRSPRLRYAAGGLALLALIAALAITLDRSLPQRAHSALPAIHLSGLPGPILSPDAGDLAAPRLPLYLPWLAPLWMAGVLAFQLRGLAAWFAARRLRRAGVCSAPPAWRHRLDSLARRMRVARPVALLESSLAEVPVVIGYLKPAILVPVGLLAGLPAEQVEAILLHELAHIRRHDYLVNLLQTVVEGLLFYHPAVWWISSVMRSEREHCCDDLAVAAQGDAFRYASALAALEARRSLDPQAVLAANGGSLVKRVRRLISQPEGPRAGVTPVISAVVLAITLAGVMAAWPAHTPDPRTVPARIVLPQPAPVQTIPSPLPGALTLKPIELAMVADPPAPAPPQEQAAPVQSPYRKWLNEDVAYIITDEERSAFKRLTSNEDSEKFIDQFWLRRDPTPGTPQNEFKEEHYRRIAYANQHFSSSIPGWKTDRGRVYITYGPPDEIDSHPNGGTYQRPPAEGGGQTSTFPFEQWRYRWIEGVGNNVIIEFVDEQRNGEYHMTSDPSAKEISSPARSGATLQAVGGNGLRLSIPLSRHGSNTVNISVRIATIDRQYVDAFEATSAGQLVFSRMLALKPGSYRVTIITKDLVTNDLTSETTTVEVK